MCTCTESNGYPEKRSACASFFDNYFVEKRLIRSMGEPRVVSSRFPLYLLFPLVGTTVFENNNIQRIENKEAKLSLVFRPKIGKTNNIIRSYGFRIFFLKKKKNCGNFRVQAHPKLRLNRHIVCFHSNIFVSKTLLGIYMADF